MVGFERGISAGAVRSYSQPIFERLVISQDGLAHGRKDVICLFTDKDHFPDGTKKVYGVDTNLPASGMLGSPLSYDLYQLHLFVQEWEDARDVRRVLAALACRWVFGGDMTYKRFTPSIMALRFDMGQPPDQEVITRIIEKAAGDVWPWRSIMMTIGATGRPVLISSTEHFRLEIKGLPVKGLSADASMKFVMQGVLHHAGGGLVTLPIPRPEK